MINDKELFQTAISQKLLEEIPFLNVSQVEKNHKRVTFTGNSTYFLLHSEPKKTDIIKLKQILTMAKGEKGTLLSEDTKLLGDFIIKIEETIDIPKSSGFSLDIEKISNLVNEDRVIAKAIIISMYLKKYLNLYWYKLWLDL